MARRLELRNQAAEELVTGRLGHSRALSESGLAFTADDDSCAPVHVRGAEWKALGDMTFEATIDCAGLEGPGYVQLMFRDEVVQAARVGIPSVLSRAHAAIDDADEWLSQLLGLETGSKRRPDGFEAGVVALLGLCGFPTIHYGHKSRDHFPDVLAWVGGAFILVGECTVDPPDLDKIRTLAARADGIRSRAQRTARELLLVRVLFTPRSTSEIAPDVIRVAREEISVAIVGADELRELLAMASRGEAASAIVSRLLDYISRFGGFDL